MSDESRTPWQAARDKAEEPGAWPAEFGPKYHRHFASDAVHRDGKPECDQPGTPRRVYVFDPDYLEEHEAAVARHAAAQAAAAVAAGEGAPFIHWLRVADDRGEAVLDTFTGCCRYSYLMLLGAGDMITGGRDMATCPGREQLNQARSAREAGGHE